MEEWNVSESSYPADAMGSTAGNTEYTTNVMNGGTKKESKALEICALVFGILGIVCCVCYGIFGLVGLILSIVCLAKGKKSGLSITGLVCSIVGLLLSILVIVVALESDTYQDMIQDMKDEFGYTMEVTEAEDDIDYDDAYVDVDDYVDVELDDEEDAGDDNKSVSADIVVEDYNQVVLYGKTITIPCKFSEIADIIQLDEYSQENFDKGIVADDCLYLDFADENGEENCISITLTNPTDEYMKDLSDAMVTSIEIYVYEFSDVVGDISFADGLTYGSSQDAAKAFVEKYTDSNSMYSSGDTVRYSGYIGDYAIDAAYDKDVEKVTEISVSYYGEFE